MAGNYFKENSRRCLCAQIFLGSSQNDLRFLIGNQAEGQLCKGLFGEDGLGSLALIAAADAIHFGGGAGPDPLDRGEPFFSRQFGDTSQFLDCGIPAGGLFEMCGGFPLPSCQRAHGVIEPGD